MFILRKLSILLLIVVPFQGALAEPLEVVFQNGRSIPVACLGMEGDKLVVVAETEGYVLGQVFPLASADHIYGIQPPEINQGIAFALTGKAHKALALLEPIVKQHAITAKIPGNFWLDAARTMLVAHALAGDSVKVTDMGKKISDATAAQGSDSFSRLGKALLIPVRPSTLEERQDALSDLISDTQPTVLCAYASFFRGRLLRDEKKNKEALEAYLSVPCLYPSGDPIVNAAAELEAADMLITLNRGSEALALVESALRVSSGTVIAEEASKRITSLKK